MTMLAFHLRSICVCYITILPTLHVSKNSVRGETFVESYSRQRFKSFFVAPPSTNKQIPPRHSHHHHHHNRQQHHRPQRNQQHQQLQKQQPQQSQQRRMTAAEDDEASTILDEINDNNSNNNNNNDVEKQPAQPPPKKPRAAIVVSGEIELPVPASVAFDAWANLPRQPTWSPWLRSVSYLPGDDEKNNNNNSKLNSKWTMSYLGLKFSWNSVTTALDRPKLLKWESTSGTKNFGEVHFEEIAPEQTRMRLTLTFLAPRVLTKIFGEKGALARVVDRRLTQQTLHNFREIVVEDYKSLQQQQQQRRQQQSTTRSSSDTVLPEQGPRKQ